MELIVQGSLCQRSCASFYCALQLSVCGPHCNGRVKVACAAAACVILLSSGAGHRKSYCKGCTKAAICCDSDLPPDFSQLWRC